MQILESERNATPGHSQLALALMNLQHAVGQCHDLVFFTDQAGVITRVNPAFERILGYTALEAVGMDLSKLVAGGPPSESYRHIWARIFAGEAYHGALSLQQKSGATCEVELTITALHDSRGLIASLVGTGRDLAGQTERDESALKVPDRETLCSVAHELNNLLMVMGANAELAFNSLPSDHKLRRNLQEIKNASRHASELSHFLHGDRELPDASEFSRLNQTAQDAWIGPRGDVVIDATEQSGALPTGPPPHSQTLLVVEDEMVIREAAGEFLAKQGYRVLSAGSGEEALDALKLHPVKVDLVITDVVLPHMSGAQLVGAVCSIHPEAKTLFISGYAENIVLRPEAAKPGVHFLKKPFPLHALAEKIEEILEQPQALAAGASV